MVDYTVVRVEWYDAAGHDDWRSVNAEWRPFMITTVGFLVYEDDNVVALAQNLGEEQEGDQEVSHSMVIPKGWIKSRSDV